MEQENYILFTLCGCTRRTSNVPNLKSIRVKLGADDKKWRTFHNTGQTQDGHTIMLEEINSAFFEPPRLRMIGEMQARYEQDKKQMQTNTISREKALAPNIPPGLYKVNEVFYSLQGEGLNAGSAMVFVRFSGCNLRCTKINAGFDCDTEFVSGRMLSEADILNEIRRACNGLPVKWVLLTGGEPALQVTESLLDALHEEGYSVAIETNGTAPLDYDKIEHISCSPKSAEHTLVLRHVHELRYVRQYGMAVPEPSIKADHYFLSPAFQPDGSVLKNDLDWCIQLCKENPSWRLSLQTHKLLSVR